MKNMTAKQLKEVVCAYIRNDLAKTPGRSSKASGTVIPPLVTETNKDGFLADVLPGKQGKAAPYVAKVTKFLEGTFEEADKLWEEGQELLASDIREHPLVGERNRLLLTLIGFLKMYHTVLIPKYIELRKAI